MKTLCEREGRNIDGADVDGATSTKINMIVQQVFRMKLNYVILCVMLFVLYLKFGLITLWVRRRQ